MTSSLLPPELEFSERFDNLAELMQVVRRRQRYFELLASS